MKKLSILIVILLSSCQLFLGPDPDMSPEGVLYSLWKDFNEMHAYIQIRMDRNKNFASWEEAYEHYNERLSKNEIDLFYACSGLLGELADPHVSMYAPGGYFYSLDSSYYTYRQGASFYGEKNEFINLMKRYLKDEGTMMDDDILFYGNFISAPDIGYIYISRFVDPQNSTDSYGWVENIDKIMDNLHSSTSAIIVDVRYNTGGIIPVMEYIAACFASKQANYLMASTKNGPGPNDFSTPLTFRVTPSKRPYTKPVIVLTNKASMSASEWFTYAMRKQDHVTHVGTSTAGAFSIQTTRPMINGWYYSISSHKVTDLDGYCYEGFGIRPHVEITGRSLDTRWQVHPGSQIEAVLEWLKNKEGE